MNGDKNNKQNPRKVFWQCGTCSRAVFHILNTEFNNPKEIEERAADPLAGGIYQKGEQCGMLWGGALGIGTESFRKYGNSDKAVATAIKSTGLLINSFVKRTKSVNCLEITNCDFSNKFDFAKFMLKTILCGFIYSPCFNLINKWAPEAIVLVKDGLLDKNINLLEPPISCASEVAKKMGASDEEIIMVAGFAGGLGLSGNGCGALSAAIWINRLQWCKKKFRNTSLFK